MQDMVSAATGKSMEFIERLIQYIYTHVQLQYFELKINNTSEANICILHLVFMSAVIYVYTIKKFKIIKKSCRSTS